VGHVPADRLDEVGNEIPAPLEFDVDLSPRLLDEVPQLDESVIRGDIPQNEYEQNRHDGDDGNFHRSLPSVSAMIPEGIDCPTSLT